MADSKTLFRNILLIDDDMDELPILEEVVHEIDPEIAITFCSNGYKIDFLPERVPDLIFLDINMPGSDGFDCLKKIRRSIYKDVPVIMYTTSGHVDQIIKAYRLGASLFMIKSHSYSKLVSHLTILFQYDWKDPKLISRCYFRDGKFIPLNESKAF